MRLNYLYTILLVAFSTGVFACDCSGYDSIVNAFNSADVVFEGKVLDIDTVFISDTVNAITSKNPKAHIEVFAEQFLAVKFSITKLFKGDKQNVTVIVMTPAAGSACGIQFGPDISYVVYGYSEEFNLVGNGNLNTMQNPETKTTKISGYSTNSCTRTKMAKFEISELKSNKLI